MTKEVLKLALEGVEIHSPNSPEYIVCAALIEALRENAMREVQRLGQEIEQEPVAWLEPEWGEKICPEVGYEVTMTDDHPRDLCWIPLYAHPPQGEPVAWQLWVGADTPLNAPMGWQFYSTYDSLKSAEISARTINSYQQAPFAKIVPLYTSSPQRTWVGLTDEEENEYNYLGPDMHWVIQEIAAKLKEKNT